MPGPARPVPKRGRQADPSPSPSPVDDALDQLARLAAAGASPERVTEMVGGIVAGWASEADMGPAAAQARIGQLWDSLGKDAADLEERISDAPGGDGPALASARRALAALQAAVTALAAAHERL